MVHEYDPDELPTEVECRGCGEIRTVPSSWKALYDDDGNKKPGGLRHRVPTSKRIADQYWCPCGRFLAAVRDPHWPTGASGGYVANP